MMDKFKEIGQVIEEFLLLGLVCEILGQQPYFSMMSLLE